MFKIITAKDASSQIEASRIRNNQAAIKNFNVLVVEAIESGNAKFYIHLDMFKRIAEEIQQAGYIIHPPCHSRDETVAIEF